MTVAVQHERARENTKVTAAAEAPPPPPPSATGIKTRIQSIDAFRGFVMFLMLAEVMQLWTLHRGVPGQHVLGDRRLQHDARAVAGLLAARPDSARVLVPGRRVAAVLDREPQERAARASGPDAGPRHVAQRGADPAGDLPALAGKPADILDLRGHAHADRPRLHVPVPAGLHVAARAGDGVRRDPRRLLAGVRRSIRCRRPGFDYTSVGVPADWPHLYTGFLAHFNKNSNLSWAFDVWFLNLFPRAVAVPLQRAAAGRR